MSRLKYWESFLVANVFDAETFEKALKTTELTESHIKVCLALFDVSLTFGRIELTQAELAALCGMSVRNCRRIITVLKDEGIILTTRNSKSSNVFFLYSEIYDEFVDPNLVPLKAVPDPPEVPEAPKVNKKKTIALTSFKDELFDKIQQAYHPKRAFIQAITAKEAFRKACTESSRPYTERISKRRAVQEVFDKVAAYIEYLKTTRAWTEDDGKYLLGLGNLLKSGAWRNPVPKVESSTEKDLLKEIFRK